MSDDDAFDCRLFLGMLALLIFGSVAMMWLDRAYTKPQPQAVEQGK